MAGNLLVGGGGTLNWGGGVAYGKLNVASNGLLNITGSVVLQNALTNSGTVNWIGGVINVQNINVGYTYQPAWVVNLAGGLWNIQCDQTMYDDSAGAPFFQNAGTVQKSASSGTTSISVPFYNTGAATTTQGTLALNGGFTPGSGTLSSGISGLASFGRISISGNATLGGTVGATLLGGYVPALSNSFAVVTYGSRTGIFTNIALPSAVLWQTNYSSTAFTLTVSMNQLAFPTPPSDTPTGAILASVVAQAQDPNGNPTPTNGVPVTVALSSGSGTLSGTLTRNTDSTGKAVFNDLSIDLLGPKMLTASAAGFAPARTTFQIVQQIPPPSGIVSWWRAENSALDSVGTNNGALVNGASFAPGKVGQAFSLDGSSQSISIPDAPSLRPASVTLEAWILFNSATGLRVIVVKPLGSATLDSYGLWWDNGNLKGAICDGAGFGPVLAYPFSPITGQWHHVAYTFDGGTKLQALYLDGLQVGAGSANKSIGYDSQPVLLGRDTENGSPAFFFAGRIDEAAIYNRALSAAEVASIYNAGSLGKVFSPLLLRASLQGGTILLSFAATPGKAYTVQSANALNAAAWGILTNVVAVTTNVLCSDSITNGPQHFYRVMTGN
jgi:hypothetical protein